MILHYLKNTFRTINMWSATIIVRILSILLGALSIAIILTHLGNELTMDNFHNNAENIFAYIYKNHPESDWRSGVINAKEKAKIPEIRHLVNIQEYSDESIRISYKENKWTSNGLVVDSTFFDVFDFELIIGDEKRILHDPQSIILSKDLASKIYGNTDPIGKSLTVTIEHSREYIVRGILDDLPANCSMDFNFLIPSHADRFSRLGVAFVKLNSDVNQHIIEKIHEATKEHYYGITRYESDLIPLKEIYFTDLNIQFYRIFSKHGDIRNIQILSIILLIIFVVCMVNAGSLKFSQDLNKRKNLALKRICGATNKHLIIQTTFYLLRELLIIVVLGVIVLLSIKPLLEKLFLETEINTIQTTIYLTLVGSFILLSAYLISSFFITRSTPNNSIVVGNKRNFVTRNWLVSFQFGFTIFLIVSSIVVARQYNAMLDKDLGFNYENIIVTNFFSSIPRFENRDELLKARDQRKNNRQLLQNELSNNPNIIEYSTGSLLSPYPMEYKKEETDQEFETEQTLIVTPGYDKTLGLEVTEGRFFDWEKDASRGGSIVINQAAKEKFQITDITKDRLKNSSWGSKQIIGVVKDFHYQHLASNIQPLIMYFFNDPEIDYLIKINEGSDQEALKFLGSLNTITNPGLPFTYRFLQDDIKELYDKEKQLSYTYLLFTIIICSISAMGLFAFAYHAIQHRIKEIGIRKVNGARVSEVLVLLNKDIIKWIFISFLIAAPLAWYFMDQWLKGFAFRIALDWWVFTSAGLFTLVIALLTISYLTWKAATRNPVEALRYE